jgi:hypothetical protein
MADEHVDPNDNDELPLEVVSPLEQMAIVSHETYKAFMRAGFKAHQALELTIKTLELSYYNEEYSFEELDSDEDD